MPVTLTAPVRSPLAVSRFERVSGMLATLLILSSPIVAGLLLSWLLGLGWPGIGDPRLPGPEIESVAHGGGVVGPLVLDEPNDGELDVVEERPLDLPNLEPIVSSNFAILDQLSGTRSRVHGQNRREGPGDGDDQEGPVGVVPIGQRWQIRYAVDDPAVYARQLDFFGIELGAAGGGLARIDYAMIFAGNQSAKLARRSAEPADEKRLYFAWQDGALRAADESLLRSAGVPTERRILLQFFPAELEAKLRRLESDYAGSGVELAQIRRTVFGVRPTADGFEFCVLEQYYRRVAGW